MLIRVATGVLMQTVAGTAELRWNGKSGNRSAYPGWRGFLFGGAVLAFSAAVAVRAGVTSTNAAAATRAAQRDAAGVSDILRMEEAGISNDVVKAYVETSPIAYNLSVADIIAMRDRGIPADIITAALKRGEELRAQAAEVAPQPVPTTAAPASGYVSPQTNPAGSYENTAAPAYAVSPGYAYSSWWYNYPGLGYAYWPLVYSYPYVYPDYAHAHSRGDHGENHHQRGTGAPGTSPPSGQSGPWQPVVTGRRGGPQPPPSGSMYPINPVAQPFNDVPQTVGAKTLTFNNVPQTVGAKTMAFNYVPQAMQPAAQTMNPVKRPFNEVPQTVGRATRSFNNAPQAVTPAVRAAPAAPRPVNLTPRTANPVAPAYNAVRPVVNPGPRVVAGPPRVSAPMAISMPSRPTISPSMSAGARPMGRGR